MPKKFSNVEAKGRRLNMLYNRLNDFIKTESVHEEGKEKPVLARIIDKQ